MCKGFSICVVKIYTHTKHDSAHSLSKRFHRRRMVGHMLPFPARLAPHCASSTFKNDFGLAEIDFQPALFTLWWRDGTFLYFETSLQAWSYCSTRLEPFNWWIQHRNDEHEDDDKVRWTKPTGTVLFTAISQRWMPLTSFSGRRTHS